MATRITACLNGARAPSEHARLPVSAAELAADAAATVRAGAVAIHVHVRDLSGHETLDPETVDSAVAEIRRSVPDTPIGVTTGAWIEPSAHRRADLVSRWTQPDVASVNLGEPGHGLVMAALLEAGIGIEAGVADPGDVRRLARSGFADSGGDIGDRGNIGDIGDGGTGGTLVRVLVEPEPAVATGAEAVALAAAIERALLAAGIHAPHLHHGVDMATWDVLRAASARGVDVRVGLEDTLVAPDGSPARSNAELVRAARAVLG